MQLDNEFSELLGSIYQGPLEERPWQSFLALIKTRMQADTSTLVLKRPSSGDPGVLLVDGGRTETVNSYQHGMFALDPFANMKPGDVCTLLELVDEQEYRASELYKTCMEPVGMYDSLGMDMVVPDELEAGLRVTRGEQASRFTQADKDLFKAIYPHLERSIRIHVKMNRVETERSVYAGAIEQMALGSIILDENGRVLSCNHMAQQILAEHEHLSIARGVFQIADKERSEELKRLLEEALSASADEPVIAAAMRIPRRKAGSDLGALVRRIPASEWSEGQSVPSVAIFISDPDLNVETPVQIITRLFGFTPTEALLAMRLANGASLDEAAEQLNISRNTARTHLRAVFTKTGVSRQTLLVRLILKSVATLA